MNAKSEKLVQPPPSMDYATYAPLYDQLCDLNPAYGELLDDFCAELRKMSLPENLSAVDLGAGTGNFICALLQEMPSARVIHVDCCKDMNKVAKAKYAENGLAVEVIQDYMQTVELNQNSNDLIVCVNALNNAPPVRPILNRIYNWLKPGGYFFLIDFGRQIKVVDWALYLIKHSLAKNGVRRTIDLLRQQSQVYFVNRDGQDDQMSGRLWTHSTTELLDLLSDVGFQLSKSELCYRNYADLVVARRPASDT